MDEQEANDEFIGLVGGVRKADRLQQIWNSSYPHGTEYDKVFHRESYKSKEEVFRERALREGYTKRQIEAFLNLP